MMFKFLKIIGIGYLLSVSTLANATLIDNGDYTTDTESGLDWLDWTKTWDYTQSEALDEFGGAGWRIATATEANGLIDNQFGGSTDEEYLLLHGTANQSDFVNYAQNYSPFLEFLGDIDKWGPAQAHTRQTEALDCMGPAQIDYFASMTHTTIGELLTEDINLRGLRWLRLRLCPNQHS
jgi:hypothetical protein